MNNVHCRVLVSPRPAYYVWKWHGERPSIKSHLISTHTEIVKRVHCIRWFDMFTSAIRCERYSGIFISFSSSSSIVIYCVERSTNIPLRSALVRVSLYLLQNEHLILIFMIRTFGRITATAKTNESVTTADRAVKSSAKRRVENGANLLASWFQFSLLLCNNTYNVE